MQGDIADVERLLDDPTIDVNWRPPLGGESALHLAAQSKENEGTIVRLLLSHGADPNIATSESWTPLHWAAYLGKRESVKLLITAGAQVNIQESRFGHTPLVTAARTGHLDVIQILLESGADPTIFTKDGRVAYQIALQSQHPGAADLIRTYSANNRRPR